MEARSLLAVMRLSEGCSMFGSFNVPGPGLWWKWTPRALLPPLYSNSTPPTRRLVRQPSFSTVASYLGVFTVCTSGTRGTADTGAGSGAPSAVGLAAAWRAESSSVASERRDAIHQRPAQAATIE